MIAKRSVFFQIIRVAGLFFMGLVVAVVVAFSQINLETLRGDVVNVLRESTGLPIEIDGAVAWKFSVRPQVELNDVRVVNADWATHKDAFYAKKIDVTLNLVSLFRDRPTIQNIVIHDAVTCIEENEAGEYSVQPEIPENVQENKVAKDAEGQKKYPFRELGFGKVEIDKLTAHVFDKTYKIDGVSLRYMKRKEGREYAGWIKSVKNDIVPFIVSFSEYNMERKIYPMRVAVSTGGDALIANVALEGTSKMPIDFIIKGDVPDVEALGNLFGFEMENWPEISVNVAGGVDRKKMVLRKSSIAINGVNIDLYGDYSWAGKVPVVNLSLDTKSLDLDSVFPGMYGRPWIRPKRDLNVFHNIPLGGQYLRDITLNLDVNMKLFVIYRGFYLDDLSLSLRLADNHGRVKLDTGIAGGHVRVAADFDIDVDGVLYANVGGIGERIFVGDILHQLDVPDLISELPMNFELYVQASGKNLSQIMQTITGPVRLYSVGGGYAHSALVAYMYGTDFLTSLRHSIQDLFSSEKKYDQIKIKCAAVNAKLRDGRIETEQGVAVETNAINMRLAGNLDLGKEKMKLALTTVPVRGIKLSLTGKVVNSIELSGNLAEPDIAISGAAVAGKVASATGIGLLLAPFTGGIGLVAGAGVGWLAGDLLENWLADTSPCKTALERGAPAFQDDAEWINAPMADLVMEMLNK